MAKPTTITVIWTVNENHKNRFAGRSESYQKIVFPYKGTESHIHDGHKTEAHFHSDTKYDVPTSGAVIVRCQKCLSCEKFQKLKSLLGPDWTLAKTTIVSPEGWQCGDINEIEEVSALATKCAEVSLTKSRKRWAENFLDTHLEEIKRLPCPVGPDVPDSPKWVHSPAEWLRMPSGLYYHKDGFVGDLRRNGPIDYIHPLPRASAHSLEALEAKAQLQEQVLNFGVFQELQKARVEALKVWGNWFLSLKSGERVRVALECEDGRLARVCLGNNYLAFEPLSDEYYPLRIPKRFRMRLNPRQTGLTNNLRGWDSLSLVEALTVNKLGEIVEDCRFSG